MITEHHREELSQRYSRALGLVRRAMDGAGCGLPLLCLFSPDVDKACAEMDSIEAEVQMAMDGGIGGIHGW